jgi:hypothetical protein
MYRDPTLELCYASQGWPAYLDNNCYSRTYHTEFEPCRSLEDLFGFQLWIWRPHRRSEADDIGAHGYEFLTKEGVDTSRQLIRDLETHRGEIIRY